jgi:hypothetical protein
LFKVQYPMKKPGTKLWKAQAVNNRENTWERRYYNGVRRIESGVVSRESGVWGIRKREAEKALRRKVTQRVSSQAHLRKIQKDAKLKAWGDANMRGGHWNIEQ